jgi:four helix bundle protein
MGNLIVGDLSLQMVAALRPLVGRVKKQDRSLADQLVRAASSVALNVAEADYSDPGNKRARLFTAAGSANETRAALRVALAWGYLRREDAEVALALLDRIIAMLWRLTRR